ncbi:MAG: putative sulfate exporter family transporter [Novosphingobium sp.]
MHTVECTSRYIKCTTWPVVTGLLLSVGLAASAAIISRLLRNAGWPLATDPLLLAILICVVVRNTFPAIRRMDAGIDLASRRPLETAVALMGAEVNFGTLGEAGANWIGGTIAFVLVTIGLGIAIGRVAGLSPKLATLVACGNAVCGNSAISAIAPTIGAKGKDVTAAIAFTSIIGIVVVFAIPTIAQGLELDPIAGGALAGLVVYAVPQVIAAASPLGPVAAKFAVLIKLLRVLMLAPVIILCVLLHCRGQRDGNPLPSLRGLVPWFIPVFLALAAFKSASWLPDGLTGLAGGVSDVLILVAMAALGLGADVRSLRETSLRLTVTAILTLILMMLFAAVLIAVINR